MADVRTVDSKADWDSFVEFPWTIYKNDPVWVPPLRVAVKEVLDVNKNPFFKHAYRKPFLAYRGDEVVGRIVGVVDEAHNKHAKEKVVFFGFFECIDDQEVANALLDAVFKWGKEWGMEKIRGPVNPSTNHEAGLLVDGFDDSPFVMMTYNPKYYSKLLENWGLKKQMDMFAYEGNGYRTQFSERLLAHAERMRADGKIKFRTIDMKNYDRDLKIAQEIYNDAWEDNWGFVPMNDEEFKHMGKEMKMILDPEMVLFAQMGGKDIAFAVALPDVNQAFKKIPDGKLFPTGLFKLLWNLKGPGKKKTINRCRIAILGVKKRYQRFGVGPLLYTEYFTRGPKHGYPTGEASWILENNKPMIKAAEEMRFEKTKTYRILEKTLH